jgi:hypothetical protein
MENPLTFALRAEVQALITSNPGAVWHDGIITGRTLEEAPRYDVRLADGSIIWNVPSNHLRHRNNGAAADGSQRGLRASYLRPSPGEAS